MNIVNEDPKTLLESSAICVNLYQVPTPEITVQKGRIC